MKYLTKEELDHIATSLIENPSYETIKKAIEDGAKTVDDIKEMTEASTGCGGCEDEIQEILDELLK